MFCIEQNTKRILNIKKNEIMFNIFLYNNNMFFRSHFCSRNNTKGSDTAINNVVAMILAANVAEKEEK